jgi:hypothetical protein
MINMLKGWRIRRTLVRKKNGLLKSWAQKMMKGKVAPFAMPTLVQAMPVATLALGSRPRQKGLQGCGTKGSPGITSGTPGSVGKCEGVNPHTPKATPTLGDGVPVDSQNFRDQFEGSNLNGLWRSLYQWKSLEA